MAKANPSPAAPGVVADPAKDKSALVLLKVAWIVLGADLVLVSSVIALAWPDRMAPWATVLPGLLLMVGAMGTLAAGGPVVKRAQENGAAKDAG